MPTQDKSKIAPPYQDDTGKWHCGARLRGHSKGQHCRRSIPDPPYRCRYHGGTTPQVKKVQALDRLEAEAQKLVRKLIPDGATVHPEPITRLLELAAEVDTFRAVVVELVNDLNFNLRYSTENGEQLRAEVALYERALDRATRVYLDVCKLGLEERLVRIREREATAMLGALDRALADAGLTAEQQQQVKGHTARHLRAVS